MHGTSMKIECGEFLDYTKTCYLPKKNPAPWRLLVK